MGVPTLELIKAGRKGGNSPKHKWTPEELEIVRRDFDGHNDSCYRIANRLGVTFCAVKGKAARLGIQTPKAPYWTPEDEELLADLISKYAPGTVAKMLHRSVNGVVVKSKRMHLSRRARTGWFTKRDVCQILGVDHHKVEGWINSGELRASWHTDQKPQKDGGAMWHILETDLRHFIVNHAVELTGRNVDLFAIVSILSTPGE